MSSEYSPAFEDTPETYFDSPPSTPESYTTGDGGSLPSSPRGRERVLPRERRAFSVDAALDRKRAAVADISSATSGVVDLITSEASQEDDMRPHKPFGEPFSRLPHLAAFLFRHHPANELVLTNSLI